MAKRKDRAKRRGFGPEEEFIRRFQESGATSVGPPSTPCPDCNASATEEGLIHEATCPLSGGIEEVCRQDKQWFADHPGVTQRIRRMTPAERADFRYMGAGAEIDNLHYIRVTYISDGMRTREPIAVGW